MRSIKFQCTNCWQIIDLHIEDEKAWMENCQKNMLFQIVCTVCDHVSASIECSFIEAKTHEAEGTVQMS